MHWRTRELGSALSISHMMVARIWAKHGLKPQRLDRYMASNDPDFERKAADIIGLYVNPPAHAAVFCVDEKTANQALDRKDPVLPLSPGRAERHGFEYYQHGTRCRCTPRSTPKPAKCLAKLRRGTLRGQRVLGSAPQCPPALHSDLLALAQPGRAVVHAD
jgi:hypothetical protein